jgi:hypothetical protein
LGDLLLTVNFTILVVFVTFIVLVVLVCRALRLRIGLSRRKPISHSVPLLTEELLQLLSTLVD